MQNQHDAPRSLRPQDRYEHSRVSVRGVAWFVVGFFITGAVLLLLVSWMQNAIDRRGHLPDSRVESLPVDQPLQPSPGHQQLPWQDLAAMRARQQQELHQSGPLPGDSSRFRIPIDRAIDQLLQSGELNRTWPATQPYKLGPAPYAKRPVENRT